VVFEQPESHLVSWLFVKIVPLVQNLGLVDLLPPVLGFDFLEPDRDRLFSVVQNVHHVLGDPFSEKCFLLF